MNAGQLVPDDVVVGIVAERLARARLRCAAACSTAFPRTVPQAEALDRMLAERGMPLDLVLALDVSEPQLVERLLARGRPDDDRDTIRERFRQYTRLTRAAAGLLSPPRHPAANRRPRARPTKFSTEVKSAVDAASQ